MLPPLPDEQTMAVKPAACRSINTEGSRETRHTHVGNLQLLRALQLCRTAPEVLDCT